MNDNAVHLLSNPFLVEEFIFIRVGYELIIAPHLFPFVVF